MKGKRYEHCCNRCNQCIQVEEYTIYCKDYKKFIGKSRALKLNECPGYQKSEEQIWDD